MAKPRPRTRSGTCGSPTAASRAESPCLCPAKRTCGRCGRAARDQPARELAPERLGLGLADVEADDLAASGLVDAVGDDHALSDDPAAVFDLLDLGIDEEVGVTALQRPLAKRLDLVVEQARDPADLRAADPQPEALDELIDPPGRDAADIGLLNNGDQRLLTAPARRQEARE